MKFVGIITIGLALVACESDQYSSAEESMMSSSVEESIVPSPYIISGVYKDVPPSDPTTVILDQTVMAYLENGEYFVLRGRLGNPPEPGSATPIIAEVFYGHITQTDNSLVSSDLKYFDLAKSFSGVGNLEASYASNTSTINGSMTHEVSVEGLTGAYRPSPWGIGLFGMSGLSVMRDSAASKTSQIAEVIGDYSGTVFMPSGVEPVVFNITASGAISATGTETGCALGGQLSAGTGSYRIQLFGGTDCGVYSGQTLNGLAIMTNGFFIAAILDAAETGGIFFTVPVP